MKSTLIKFLNLEPKIYAFIFIGLIPVFGLIYWIIPTGSFSTDLNMDNYLTCAYYSTVTITTLGFGDISPVTNLAQVITIFETISGVVLIGLFLNSVAHLKARLISTEQNRKNINRKFMQQKTWLKRHYRVVKSDIDRYIKYTSIIIVPVDARPVTSLNKNFVFRDLKDLFKPTMLDTDSPAESAAHYYYKYQHRLEDSILLMLVQIDFSYWPQLENMCFSFLENCRKFNYSTYILSRPNTQTYGVMGSVYDSELIANYRGEIKYESMNEINAYVSLYYLIKSNINFVEEFNREIDNIMVGDPKNVISNLQVGPNTY